MKLYWAASSPFVRKVMAAAHELDAVDRIECIEATVDNIVDLVSPVNPLAQIPTLVTNDGEAIYDSTAIVEWLDEAFDGALCGRGTEDRWRIRSRDTVATGIMESAVAGRHLALQPDGHRPDSFIERLKVRRGRALAHLEATLDDSQGPPGTPITADAITTFAALGYLDFRYPDDDWRTACPGLASWKEATAARPSMQATEPAG